MASYRKFGSFTSSQNPEELSNRVKGVILALSSVIIFLGSKFFNITLTGDDVVSIATQISAVVGAVWTIYGAGLALVSKWTEVRK